MTNDNNYNRRNPFQALQDREDGLRRNREQAGLQLPEPMFVDSNTGPGGGWGMSQFVNTTTTIRGPWANGNGDLHYYQSLLQQNLELPRYILATGGPITFTEYNPPPPLTPEQIERDKRLKALRAAAEEKARIKRLYEQWRTENITARANVLNTSIYSHRKQLWSIEKRLLEAISSKQHFKTKTTEYSPSANKIYLLGHEIARISPITHEITHVYVPEFNDKKKMDLFRLRLRQLGQRCKVLNRKNSLIFSEREREILLPGTTVQISIQHRVNCLPLALRPVPVVPMVNFKQYEFNFQDLTIKKDPFNIQNCFGHYKGYELIFDVDQDTPNDTTRYSIIARPNDPRMNQIYVEQTIGQALINSVRVVDIERDVRRDLLKRIVEEIDGQCMKAGPAYDRRT